MSEEEVEQCLIEWLAAEAGELEETAYKRNEQFSSQQIDDMMLTVLKRVDVQFQLNTENCQQKSENERGNEGNIVKRQQIKCLMEDYIYRSFAKTLKRVANSDSTTLVSLVLYLLLNSAQKSEAVSRILLLPKTKQELLMIVLKGIESRLEHKVDFRYLIEKVEVVSDQNDGLREQLVHAQVEENKLVEQLAELQAENKQLKNDILFYEETKATAFSVMCICSLDDFVSYCNYERKENEEIAYNIEREEERYTGLKEEEEQLETILQTNVKEIETLAMEQERSRRDYLVLKEEYNLYSNPFMSGLQQTSYNFLIPLRQNNDLNNLASQKKLSTDRTCSSTQAGEDSCSLLRNGEKYNEALSNQLQEKTKEEACLQAEITMLRGINCSQKLKYNRASRRLRQLGQVDQIMTKKHQEIKIR